MGTLYIGLMSGTSLDGVDAVLADFATPPGRVLGHVARTFAAPLRAELLALNSSGADELHRAALAANALAECYAQAVQALLQQTGVSAQAVRAIGAAGVQSKWDAAVASAKVTSAKQTLEWTQQFSTIATHYQEQSHVQAPSIADTVSAGVRGGTVRLRDEPSQACPGRVPDASASARTADAAATAALAQRVADSIAAVRVGAACDIRDRQQSAKITALQEILRAERSPSGM